MLLPGNSSQAVHQRLFLKYSISRRAPTPQSLSLSFGSYPYGRTGTSDEYNDDYQLSQLELMLIHMLVVPTMLPAPAVVIAAGVIRTPNESWIKRGGILTVSNTRPPKSICFPSETGCLAGVTLDKESGSCTGQGLCWTRVNRPNSLGSILGLGDKTT